MRFTEKLIRFMSGRNGTDALGKACFHLYLLLFFIGLFVKNTVLSVIVSLLAVYILFRMLSKNLAARRAENMKYLNLRTKAAEKLNAVPLVRRFGDWMKKRRMRMAKLGTHRFRTCPNCHAELCLPRRKGKHTVNCPKCRRDFSVRILF